MATRDVIATAEAMDIKVFPSNSACWPFAD
jgi:hypothetical protein